MADEFFLRRYIDIVTHISNESSWSLTPQQCRAYATQISICWPEITQASDAQISAAIRYYHADHVLVDMLRNQHDENYELLWGEWIRRAFQILVSRGAGSSKNVSAADLDDLTQEALIDLWRGIQTFSYQSRFHTWAFSVISNSLVRHHRSLHALKRGGQQSALSLDEMLLTDNPPQDLLTLTPAESAMYSELLRLVRTILAEQPDQRLTKVFELWAYEDKTLRSIGEQLNLSVARIHALLQHARTLLSKKLDEQGWGRDDL